MRLARILFTLTLLAVLSACAPTTTSTPPAVASPTADYPTAVVPTASAETGVVTGRILASLDNSPMPGITVYLGDRVSLGPDLGYAISHTEDGSPHVRADANGNFALAGPPGDHALIVWTPINAKVVIDPNDATHELVVTIRANETTDLGDVIVQWP